MELLPNLGLIPGRPVGKLPELLLEHHLTTSHVVDVGDHLGPVDLLEPVDLFFGKVSVDDIWHASFPGRIH
jgi:hypothetical protein